MMKEQEAKEKKKKQDEEERKRKSQVEQARKRQEREIEKERLKTCPVAQSKLWLVGVQKALAKCDEFRQKAQGSDKIPLKDSMVGEFTSHKRAISKLRDDIDNAINKSYPDKKIQRVLDDAQQALDKLNKCASGFDAVYKIHYGNKKPV